MPLMKKRIYRRRPVGARRRPALRRPRRGYGTWVNKRSLNPIPQRSIVKMKYADSVSTTIPALTAIRQYALNLNSIFDPDRTGTGHQPYGHDTFQTLYNRYRVIGCRWNVWITTNPASASGAPNIPIQFFAIPTNDVTTFSVPSDAREKPRCKFVIQGSGAGNTVKKVSGYTSMPSLTGRTKSQYMADDRYQATFGSDPSELMVLNIGAGFMNDLTISTATDLFINFELTYVVECFDPKILPQS